MEEKKTAYLQLYETLRQQIVQGIRPYGEKLPSRRQTARDRHVSPITVEHSYELLCQEGYIESRARSGFYVIYRSQDGFAQPDGPARPLPPAAYAPARGGALPPRAPGSVPGPSRPHGEGWCGPAGSLRRRTAAGTA